MALTDPKADTGRGHALTRSAHVVRANVMWRGREQTIEGRLDSTDSTFLIVNEQVIVKLLDVQPPLEGNDATAVWVPAQSLQPPRDATKAPHDGADSLLLRSDLREIPAGQARAYALRTLSLTLAEFVAAYGVHIALSPGVVGTHELSLTMDIPGSAGTDYLWKFQLATRQCRTQAAVWPPPPAAFAEAALQPRDRPNAAHYTGQLPLWLTTRRFWSIFRWHDERLQHTVQFSMEDKLQRTLVRRFRLQSA